MKRGYSSRGFGEVRCISNFNDRWICIGGEKFFIIDHNAKNRKFKKENSFHPGGGQNSKVNHVEWNKKNQKYILTAPFNGNVVLWDLSIRHGKKIGRVYDSHKELVHQVRWSPKDPNTFYSSSKDRTVRIWDIRDKGGCRKTLNCDDMVYGIDVNPFNTNIIVSGTYSAKLLVWDLAKPEKPLQTLESSVFEEMNPVYSVRFHPKKKNLLCSGGRDKILRIWNLQRNNQVKKDTEVRCISDIKRCEWQPNDATGTNIAVGYRGAHHKVHFYNLNFPYVPQYEYFYGIDNLLDFVFLGKDKVCTVSKRGKVTFKHIQDGENVQNSVRFRKFGCQWNVRDHISQFKNDDMPTENNTRIMNRKRGRRNRKGSSQHSQSKSMSSVKSGFYNVFGYFKSSKNSRNPNSIDNAKKNRRKKGKAVEEEEDDDDDDEREEKEGHGRILIRDIPIPKFSIRPMKYFEYFANNYKIFQSDISVIEKCRHNANVARRIERHDLVRLWEILEKAYITRQKFKRIKEKLFQEKKEIVVVEEEEEEEEEENVDEVISSQQQQPEEEEEEERNEDEKQKEILEELEITKIVKKEEEEEVEGEELEEEEEEKEEIIIKNDTEVSSEVLSEVEGGRNGEETSEEGEETSEEDEDEDFLNDEVIKQMTILQNRNLRKMNKEVFLDEYSPSPTPTKKMFFNNNNNENNSLVPPPPLSHQQNQQQEQKEEFIISDTSESSSSSDESTEGEEDTDEEFYEKCRPSLSFHMMEDQISFKKNKNEEFGEEEEEEQQQLHTKNVVERTSPIIIIGEEEEEVKLLLQQQQLEEEEGEDVIIVESQSKGIIEEQEKIYSELLMDLLNEYCDQGDVQTCVAVTFLLQENPQMSNSKSTSNNNNNNNNNNKMKRRRRKDEEEDFLDEDEEKEKNGEGGEKLMDGGDSSVSSTSSGDEKCEINKNCIMPMIPISENRIIDWTVGYIEILNRFRLYQHSTELIKMNCLKEVKRLHQFLEMRISCGICHRTLDYSGGCGSGGPGGPAQPSQGKGGPGQPSMLVMLCRKCNTRVSRCLICNLTVRDQYYFCPTCGTGGHLRCYEKWFKKFSKCPMCLPPSTLLSSGSRKFLSNSHSGGDELNFDDDDEENLDISSNWNDDFQLCEDLS